MKVYSYSEARQRMAELLNRARREGQVEIRRRDGQRFVVRPKEGAGSPLDVPGVDSEKLYSLADCTIAAGANAQVESGLRFCLNSRPADPAADAD